MVSTQVIYDDVIPLLTQVPAGTPLNSLSQTGQYRSPLRKRAMVSQRFLDSLTETSHALNFRPNRCI